MRKTIDPEVYVGNIRKSGLTIYDPIRNDDPDLWVPTRALELLLDGGLRGLDLAGLANRTRSKVIKEEVCKALGYPIPARFTKTKPRFPGQNFDTYGQKKNNLQIWNEECAPTRRYVIIRISDSFVVQRVKVVTGDKLLELDKTGTLTQKYQARFNCGEQSCELVSTQDTGALCSATNPAAVLHGISPIANPKTGSLLPISIVFERLKSLIGFSFADRENGQERLRGADVHRLVCQCLGFSTYADDGQFPDVRNQLLEVKVQTASTIDLGLVRPDSKEPLDVPKLSGREVRHCDVRYALFFASTHGTTVTITHFFLTTGEAFFSRFPQFQGKVLNKKLQIPLPADFFD